MLFSDSTHFCYTLTLISTTPLVKMHLEQPCGCVAMKAPVGLSNRRAVCVSRWKGFALTSVRAATNAKNKNQIPLNMPRVQQRRPLPAAEAGRSCWGRGQQDASAFQSTKRMLGAATRAWHGESRDGEGKPIFTLILPSHSFPASDSCTGWLRRKSLCPDCRTGTPASSGRPLR